MKWQVFDRNCFVHKAQKLLTALLPTKTATSRLYLADFFLTVYAYDNFDQDFKGHINV